MSRRLRQGMQEERAALYVRVSLDRAAKGMQEEILSPETQADRARAYCIAQGWQVVAEERDIDESGYRQHYTKRSGLMRLLEMVKAGQVSKIVVWKFSRLSRRLKEFIEICDLVEAHGGGVVSVSEQVDTSTPAGRLIRNILASFAQFQSEEISEQIFETWVTRAKQGRRPPGNTPFGTVNNKGILEPDPEQHRHLIAMYQVFRDTGSVRAVWDYLTAHRVPPPQAEEWNLNTIRGILTNPIYVGRIEWAGEVYQAQWPPLVPVSLWEEVQDIFARRRHMPVNRKDARMLSGIICCSLCGRPMWVRYGKRSRNGVTESVRLYWCATPSNCRKGCNVPMVDAVEVEAAVWQAVDRFLGDQNLHNLLSTINKTEDDQDEYAARRRQLLLEKERIERATGELFDMLEKGDITREQFRARNAYNIERLRAIQAQLDQLPLASGRPDPVSVRSALELAKTATTEQERREVLNRLGAEVIVSVDRVYLEFLGLRINLKARRIGNSFHFGPEYQRLDYQGPLLTDKQIRFLQRTYRWADKKKLAARLGRQYQALISRARDLGLSPEGRGRWHRYRECASSTGCQDNHV